MATAIDLDDIESRINEKQKVYGYYVAIGDYDTLAVLERTVLRMQELIAGIKADPFDKIDELQELIKLSQIYKTMLQYEQDMLPPPGDGIVVVPDPPAGFGTYNFNRIFFQRNLGYEVAPVGFGYYNFNKIFFKS